VVPYRSPIPVAKLLASVDVLSGGRLVFGAAVGWLEGEFDALSVPFKERGRRTDEALELIRALWTQEYPELTTARHHVHGVKASPMPLQHPRPPILIGGSTEAAFRRVARLGDGWHASSCSPQTFRAGAGAVTSLWKGAGREGAPLLTLRVPVLLEGVHRPAVDPGLLGARHTLSGPIQAVLKDLRAYQAAGCSHVALEVSYGTYPSILDTIDVVAEQIAPALARG
jgi:alkanesulfonate monooxygenase SsuD/methylene tetrahydromethanopterin reductase-like flavin-dependent oxidoreductase (luciferase family)